MILLKQKNGMYKPYVHKNFLPAYIHRDKLKYKNLILSPEDALDSYSIKFLDLIVGGIGLENFCKYVKSIDEETIVLRILEVDGKKSFFHRLNNGTPASIMGKLGIGSAGMSLALRGFLSYDLMYKIILSDGGTVPINTNEDKNNEVIDLCKKILELRDDPNKYSDEIASTSIYEKILDGELSFSDLEKCVETGDCSFI